MEKTAHSKVQGEGDYISGREFREAERKFVEEGRVPKAAREAVDALSGPEARALEQARRVAAEGRAIQDERIAHREDNLDEGLDETFPASDPVSICPGSN